MSPPADSPVIIIGAARSGTNMLRDVLCSLPGITTWPCDEIPYIWRHGNREHPDDEFSPAMARPDVQRYILNQFRRIRNPSTRVVVEKTCANSLRVGFVSHALPDARLVVITRQGHDAIASAMKRWTAGFDWRYSLAKACYLPLSDVPALASSFCRNRINRLVTADRRLKLWGPIFKGMRELPPDIPLIDLATLQWRRCMERTAEDLARLPSSRFIRIDYEEFVCSPTASLAAILEFLQIAASADQVEAAVQGVHRTSIRKAAQTLSAADLARIDELMAEMVLQRADEEQRS